VPLPDLSQGLVDPSDLLTAHHVFRAARRSLCFEENYLGYFLSSVSGFSVALYYPVPHSEGFPLGPVAFVREAAFGHVFPFWALSGLCFLQNGPFVLVAQLFCSQSRWISAGCGYSRESSHLLDVCPRLEFVAVGTLLLAWSSRKRFGIVVFPALAVFGSEYVLL
jgi:hypothetical protein